MLIETIILALAIGLISGGSLRNLGRTTFRGAFFIFSGLILRNFPVLFKLSFLKEYADAVNPFAPTLFIVSYIFLFIGVLLNISRWPVMVVFAGVLSNFIAVISNRGFMPVSGEGLVKAGYDISAVLSPQLDMNHVLITSQTRFPFLTDIIAVPRPYPFPQMLSIGDILICLGLFFFIVLEMQPRKGKRLSDEELPDEELPDEEFPDDEPTGEE